MEKLNVDSAFPLTNIRGMNESSAKKYVLGFITTLKLTNKQIQDIDKDLSNWNSRIELAKYKGLPDLVIEAEKEVELLENRRQQLVMETDEFKMQIEDMLRQLPLLPAYERNIEPDMLENELLIASGYLPGEEEKAKSERLFRKMEKEITAEAALSELKAKMERKD
ncbi:MAG: chromosome partitioning protein [Treponema sp.]|jgi:septal ring factor EnvC (AmiA/AmiB activator)|nr:chromosome partitioning protein [Treponema sp.]